MQLVGTVVLFLFLLVRLFVSFVRLFLFLCVLLICLLVCARVRVCACGVGMYVVTYLVALLFFKKNLTVNSKLCHKILFFPSACFTWFYYI